MTGRGRCTNPPRHCERKRSNPVATPEAWIVSAFALRASADAVVARAPRNDGVGAADSALNHPRSGGSRALCRAGPGARPHGSARTGLAMIERAGASGRPGRRIGACRPLAGPRRPIHRPHRARRRAGSFRGAAGCERAPDGPSAPMHCSRDSNVGVATIDGRSVADPGFLTAPQKITKSYEQPECWHITVDGDGQYSSPARHDSGARQDLDSR
jgi:hypothetical protein